MFDERRLRNADFVISDNPLDPHKSPQNARAADACQRQSKDDKDASLHGAGSSFLSPTRSFAIRCLSAKIA